MDNFYKWMEENPVLAIAIGTAAVLLIYYYYGGKKKTSTSSSSDTATTGLSAYYAAETASTNASSDASIASINAGRDVDIADIYSNRDIKLGDQKTTQDLNWDNTQSGIVNNNNFYDYWNKYQTDFDDRTKADTQGFWDYKLNDQTGHQISDLALQTGASATDAALLVKSYPTPTRTFH